MIYRRRRNGHGANSGFFQFHNSSQRRVFGTGDGDFIRLRDEHGNEWRGVADVQEDNTVRFRFRDESGGYITGISDGNGILLRDEDGNTWRGFVD